MRKPWANGHVPHAKCVYAWQAHLKRISHYLIEGKGAWWHTTESGDVCFDDGGNDLESVHKGPCLLHFHTSKLSEYLLVQSALSSTHVVPLLVQGALSSTRSTASPSTGCS